MTVHEATQQLLSQLFHIYDEREAVIITDWVMEKVTGWKKIDRLVNKAVAVSAEQEKMLEQYTKELLEYKPIQYALKEAWFYGMKLYVDESVLIPRPETEELVKWVVESSQQLAAGSGQSTAGRGQSGEGQQLAGGGLKILDIGTGSGCIAIAIKKNIPGAEVWACDVSDVALNVARLNADSLHALIDFVPLNFLEDAQRQQLPHADIIVSNPPYVPLKDKTAMAPNVLNYEPHVALFVANNDALVFYKAIADFSLLHLKEGGSIYVEIHEDLGKEVVNLFKKKGYTKIELRKDLQGKDRMVKVSL